jgi:hypothetical protein
MVRKRGCSAVLGARRCRCRGKTQHFAAKKFPAALVRDYSQIEDKLRARLER